MTYLEYGELFLQQNEIDKQTFKKMSEIYRWDKDTISKLARIAEAIHLELKDSQASLLGELGMGFLEEISRMSKLEDQKYLLKLVNKLKRDELRDIVNKVLEIESLVNALPDCSFKQQLVDKYFTRMECSFNI